LEYRRLADRAIRNGYARGRIDGVELMACAEWYVTANANGRRVSKAPTVVRADGERVLFFKAPRVAS
jgi:hypothetical protein